MFISRSPEETSAFGEQMAGEAAGGDVFALVGELGAGKTEFVKGFVRGSGSKDPVTSPTFTLVHEYNGERFPIYHFDFYRIRAVDELWQLGLDDYLFGEGVSLIEWADRFPEVVPKRAIWLEFHSRGETEREITRSAGE